MPLTDKQIQSARSPLAGVSKLSDGGGLQLWLTASGGKHWNLAYRFAGKQRKLAIGRYPTVTLREARERREDAKRQLEKGLDPSRQKQLARLAAAAEQANTFGVLAEDYLERKRKEGKALATLSKLEWLLGIAKPALGARPVNAITVPEVLRVLRSVEARDKLESAKRLRAVIGAVFRFGMALGRANHDPTQALRGSLTPPKVRHRAAIIDPKGVGELLRAVEAYSGSPEVRAGLQLLALTFLRPGELRKAKWEEINFDLAVWDVPGAHMKMGRPHRVPLARRTIEVLKGLQQLTGDGDFVLTSAWARGRPISENTLNTALRRMGFTKEEMTSHGFRATASSMLNESGLWNADAIEAQLAHVEANSVRRAYARAEFWEERIRMMEWWANRLDELRQGGEVLNRPSLSH